MLFFYTCIVVLQKHLLEMEVMESMNRKTLGTEKASQTTLCCSDDTTKLAFVIAWKGNSVSKIARTILVTFNVCCRVVGRTRLGGTSTSI